MPEWIENAPAPDALDVAVRAVVDELATEVGQTVPVRTEISSELSRTGGIAAYHVEPDKLYLDPALAQGISDDPGSYYGTGVVLHELGHRADRKLMLWRLRSVWWTTYAIALPMPVLLTIGTWAQQPWALTAMGVLIALWSIVFLVVRVPLCWYSEFRADDFCCDVGGIARAAIVLTVFSELRLTFGKALAARLTHPPTSMRLRRQMRRAGFDMPPRAMRLQPHD